ncbi:MAG: ATP-dependent DNA ligase [Rubricoccaceae bacterium]|nr:ATP-dependent DNA ligase [Rubricoccaceae bacterium]
MPESAPFLRFAETAEAVTATAKRNEKADRLAALYADLSDDDLMRAARWSAGRPFPLHDQRTTSVGYAALLDAVAAVAGTTRDALRPALVRLGDPGDVAAEALADHAPEGEPVTLEGLDAWLGRLAETRGTKRKVEALSALLRRLSGVETKYVIKLLSGDLRIGVKQGGVENAIARGFGHPIGAVQRATMLTGDLGETARLARHDRLGEARMRLYHPLGFMLATAADDPDDVARQMPTPFAVEDKYDGIRAQAHVGPDPGDDDLHGVARGGTRVALFSRTLDGIAASFPDLVEPLAALLAEVPGGLILDGEIVPVDPEGRAAIRPFQALQKRLGRKTVTDATLAESPVAFIVYDALFFDGEVVLEEPYRIRQERLDALGLPGTASEAPVRRSAVSYLDTADDLDAHFDAARERGNEGLMVKAPEAPYKPGRRGRDWLKVKRALATLDCVVTSVEVGSGKRRHLLSDFTFAVRKSETDDTLLNVGKAYSGLTDAELAALTDWFEAHTLQSFAHGRVRVVEPGVVIEVAFDRVQVSKRHKGGYALRFPRIVRLREDKPVEEIDTLDAVAALADA